MINMNNINIINHTFHLINFKIHALGGFQFEVSQPHFWYVILAFRNNVLFSFLLWLF